MSVGTARATRSEEAPTAGPSLLDSLVAAVVCPFDSVLAGMVGAGFGIVAICLYLDLTRAALDVSLVRLGLPTPHNRPLRKLSAKAWPIIDTRRVILWRQIGIHPDVISVRLGRSANAIRGKARRLGIQAPDRKSLRRVDPWSLPEPVPGFGFPNPRSSEFSEPAAHAQPSTEDTMPPPPPTDNAATAPARRKRPRKVPAQRELTLLPGIAVDEPAAAPAPLSEPEQINVSPVADTAIAASATAEGRHLTTAIVTHPSNAPSPSLLPTSSLPAVASEPEEETPEDDDLTWIGKLQHVIYDKEAVRIIGMRQMGLEHWRRTASVPGLTPGQLKTIRTRIDIPIDRDRRKFDATYDPELAQLNFDTCGYTLMQERPIPNTGRAGHWFYRRNGSKDWFSLWTQLHVNKTIDKRTYDFSRVPVDLHTSIHSQKLLKPSLPFMQGTVDEKRACRGHTPLVRSGFPGRPGHEMPWTYPRVGSAARGVAHP